MKTETRMVAEKIQALTGRSLVRINWEAAQFVQMGLLKTHIEALKYILELESK